MGIPERLEELKRELALNTGNGSRRTGGEPDDRGRDAEHPGKIPAKGGWT